MTDYVSGPPDEPLVEPDNALPEIGIEDLPAPLLAAVKRLGWTELTPVQAKGIPYLREERDLLAQSRTGSGKTAAFVLPILERIDAANPVCQVLVLVPTRELAQQVARDARDLAADTEANVVEVYGGVSYGPQLDAFRRGAHLVVGTPGRILDHLLRGSLSLDGLRMLVFDEADRMLSMGFYPDMQRIHEFVPDRSINACMFSATFPPNVMRLAKAFLEEPEFLSLSRDHVHVTEVQHEIVRVPAMDKDRCLVQLIEIENPSSALIFCNTRAKVHYVNVVLQRFGFSSDELSSDLSQQARTRVLGRLRRSRLRFLVATDVAARGIDIPELSHVFLYEVPDDQESYIHRAGRTGRAGASGTAISLVGSITETQALRRIGAAYQIAFEERKMPDEQEVAAVVTERLMVHLEHRLRDRDRLQTERMQRFIPLAKIMHESDEALQALAMLLDDTYHQATHGQPQENPERGESRHRPQSSRRRPRGRRSRS